MIFYPMKFNRITAPFDYYTVNGKRSMHYAIDLAGYTSDATVMAAHGGEVLYSFYDSAGGNMVILRGDFGGEYDVISRYAHLASRSVSPGERVAAGQKIGIQGNTGSFTTGMHLHFEIWLLPKNVPYGFSDRAKYAIDPLSVCQLTEGQTFDPNGKTEYRPLRFPEIKVEVTPLDEAKFLVSAPIELFFYPDNLYSPIVGGEGRSKRYLTDFFGERTYFATDTRDGGGALWAGIRTGYGLLWAPVIPGRSELILPEKEEVAIEVKETEEVKVETVENPEQPNLEEPSPEIQLPRKNLAGIWNAAIRFFALIVNLFAGLLGGKNKSAETEKEDKDE